MWRRSEPGATTTSGEPQHGAYSYATRIGLREVRRSGSTTLSKKFQISIPKAVRDEQQWKAGQEFVFIPKGVGVLMVPVPTLADLAGIAKGADASDYRDRNDRF